MDPPKPELSHEIFPFARVYTDGSIERLAGTGTAPPGLDQKTGVLSKDTIINPETGVSARLYRPSSAKPHQNLPLVVYYHGGGFFISSTADPNYHNSLNKLVAAANILLVSVNYRLAPEAPLPAAYEDSWGALEWVAGGHDPWIEKYSDLGRVFLAGDSCGANMSHHFAIRLKRLGEDEGSLCGKLKIEGMIMIQPYFWGKEPVGVECTDPLRKSMVDGWWNFVCPSDQGCDDPLINPFGDGSPHLDNLAVERVIIAVAGNDILRDRGRVYYERLVKSGWKGKAEIMESEGEDHVFHIIDPDCLNANELVTRVASFINRSKHDLQRQDVNFKNLDPETCL